MIITADFSFSSFCPYSFCLSLCWTNADRLSVSLHNVPASLHALFKIRAESSNKQAVFPKTLHLYSLRFEGNWDKGNSIFTCFSLDGSLPLNLKAPSALPSMRFKVSYNEWGSIHRCGPQSLTCYRTGHKFENFPRRSSSFAKRKTTL